MNFIGMIYLWPIRYNRNYDSMMIKTYDTCQKLIKITFKKILSLEIQIFFKNKLHTLIIVT